MNNKGHWSDKFFSDLYPRFDQLRHNNVELEIGCINELCNLPNNQRVIELCCGYGRITNQLAKNYDYKVIGLDKSKSLIKIARNNAKQLRVNTKFIVMDLLKSKGSNLYDASFLFGTSFGYYSEKQNRIMLCNIRSHLKNGSTFVFQQVNNPNNIVVQEEDSEYTFYRHSSFEKNKGIYSGYYQYYSKSTTDVINLPFKIILYSASILRRVFYISRFEIVDIYGDFDLFKYTPKSPQLIIKSIAI